MTIESVQLRVFVTSRLDQLINLGFDGISREIHLNFILHNIEQLIVNYNLHMYYKDTLEDIAKGSNLSKSVVSKPTIQCLISKSNGLFIYAAMVCRFIRNGEQLANERLSLLLDARSSPIKPKRELD